MTDALLRIENLKVVYNGAVVALTRVDLDVRPREIVALLGSNGAGKTTVLRSVSNLLQAVRGKANADVATYDGRDILGRSPGDLLRAGIAPVLEGRRVFAPLTVEENLIAGAIGAGKSRPETRRLIERVYEFFPKLAERRRSPAGTDLGRRAADARHRPRADVDAAAADARRAVDGAGAAASCRTFSVR